MKTSAFMTIERDDIEIEVEITAEANSPEHDVGIMDWWFEDVCAESLGDKRSIDLTDKEQEKAEEILREKLNTECFYDYDEP